MVVDAIGAIDRLEIEAGGFTFTGRACGPHEGRTVLLLHGFPRPRGPGATSCGRWAAPATAPSHPTSAATAPGARPAEVGDYATEHLLQDVIDLADSMHMETFDLVGHDWGGMLGLGRWPRAIPGRVRTLSVVSTPHPLALHEALRGADPTQAAYGASMDAFRTAGGARAPAARRRRCRGRPRHAVWPRPVSMTRMPGCMSPP